MSYIKIHHTDNNMKAETDYWLQAHQFNAHHSFIHSISHNEHKIAYFAQHKPSKKKRYRDMRGGGRQAKKYEYKNDFL